MALPGRKRLGELLVEAHAIDERQLQAALTSQKQYGGRLGSALVRCGFLTEDALVGWLGRITAIPVVDLSSVPVSPEALQHVPRDIAEKMLVLPLEVKGPPKAPTLVVAMAEPTDLERVDELRFRLRERVQPVLAGERAITAAIARHYGEAEARAAAPAPEPVTEPALAKVAASAPPPVARPPEELLRPENAAVRALVELLVHKGVFSMNEYAARLKR